MSNRKALLGKKLGMSQVWDENGFFVPVTLVDVSTNVVTAVKSEESDGYKAVQLGYGQVDPTKVTKPLAGHFAKAGVTPRRHLAEVRTDNAEEFEPGQELTAELFPEGTLVDVTGTTKGKGFGLGLFLSQASVTRAGGTVKLYNHEEGGTLTELKLPRAYGAA